MTKLAKRPGWQYGVALGLVAVGVRAALQPVLGNQLPFMAAFPMCVIAAALFGWQSGACVALVTSLAAILPQLPPYIAPSAQPLQVGGFLIGSVLMALFLGRLRPPVLAGAGPDKFETPLTHWLRAVLWGAFLIPLIVFMVGAWWGYQRALHDAEGAVRHAADLAYSHAQHTFQVAEDIARRADAAVAGDDATVRLREAAIHQRYADMTTGVPSVINLNAWDARGRPLVRSDRYPVDPDARVDDRHYFVEQRDAPPPGLGVSQVLQGRQTGLDVVNATLRRSSADGRFVGVVAVSLSPSYFREYYQSLVREAPNLASFALLRLDGSIIARWPGTPDAAQRAPADSPVLRAIAAGRSSGVVPIPERASREARLAAYRRLPDYPVYVVASASRAGMFADWARFVALLASTLLPASAGLVYVGWVALKKTRREAVTAAELQEEIRRRANAEQSMLQSQKLETLALVTGGIAHDFNNLLAIVNASLHVLKRQRPELAADKQVQAMTRAIQSGTRLTRQLLSFTRRQALKPETVELQSWLPATEGLMRSTLGPNILFEARVEPDTQAVHVDLGELELALINLVVNARHAMPAGGTLVVHASNAADPSAERPMVRISVRDTGVGIAPELLGRVFEPFFTTRGKGTGSGLGLSQVQGFCTQAGGDVRIESTPGVGTTVAMLLPATQAVPAETGDAPLGIRLSGSMLLVEDNEDVAATTASMLRAAGLQVTRRPNAAAALVYLDSVTTLPDVVLSDIAMPGSMDGIALAFELRKRHPRLPVLLTTGYSERLHQALEGGLKVLPKPVAPEELLGALGAALGTVGAPSG